MPFRFRLLFLSLCVVHCVSRTWSPARAVPIVAPAVNSIRSQMVNLQYHLNQCAEAFGMPMHPITDAINAKFGGAEPKETNVFYSNGSQDPWQRAAVNHTLSSTQPEMTAVCDSCGHCGDLEPYASSDAVQKQRAAIQSAVLSWVH